MVERIENAVPPMILEYIRTQIQNEERWSFSAFKNILLLWGCITLDIISHKITTT